MIKAAKKKKWGRAEFLKTYSRWRDDPQVRKVRFLEPRQEIEPILSTLPLSYEQRARLEDDKGGITGRNPTQTRAAVLEFLRSTREDRGDLVVIKF